MNRYFITIDPGVSGTGLALFNGKKIVSCTNFYAPASTMRGTYSHYEKGNFIVKEIDAFCSALDLAQCMPMPVFIEEPAYHGGPKHYKGQVAAESGSLAKLCFFYGRLWQLFCTRNCSVFSVSIAAWKGTLPKDVSHNRIQQRLQKEYSTLNLSVTNHALDAIGIGFFILDIKK